MAPEEIERRLSALESEGSSVRREVSDLREVLVLTIAVQKTHAESLQHQAHSIAKLVGAVDQLGDSFGRLNTKVDELAGKVDGVIGYLDHLPRQAPPLS